MEITFENLKEIGFTLNQMTIPTKLYRVLTLYYKGENRFILDINDIGDVTSIPLEFKTTDEIKKFITHFV